MKRFSDFIKTALNESVTVYRGIPVAGQDKDRRITWVSTSKEHATMYSQALTGNAYGGEVLKYRISGTLVPIDLGFRSADTFVTYEDIRGRIIDAILARFEKKRLTEARTLELLDELRSLKLPGSNRVHTWMRNSKIVDVIEKAGFNCILQHEGMQFDDGNIITYGLLDKSLLSLQR